MVSSFKLAQIHRSKLSSTHQFELEFFAKGKHIVGLIINHYRSKNKVESICILVSLSRCLEDGIYVFDALPLESGALFL